MSWVWYSYSHFHKTVTLFYITKNAFCLKRGVWLDWKISNFGWKPFFRPKSAKCFLNLGISMVYALARSGRGVGWVVGVGVGWPWLNNVSTSERRRHINNIFSHWLRPCSATTENRYWVTLILSYLIHYDGDLLYRPGPMMSFLTSGPRACRSSGHVANWPTLFTSWLLVVWG